jgi:hypothetical protein
MNVHIETFYGKIQFLFSLSTPKTCQTCDMSNLQTKAYTNNGENTGLQQQQGIHLRDAKLAIRLLEEDQEWELQTLMYILLSLWI